MNAEDEEYHVEQFTLEPSEYKELVEVVKEAFLEGSKEEGGTMAFDEESFNFLFGSPSMPNDFFIRAIHNPTGDLAGFLGGIPRDLSYNGKIYKFGVPSWAAVLPKHQRKGLAIRMGLKLLEIAKERKFEGGIAFFEPEAHGKDAAKVLITKTGIPETHLTTVTKFIIRVFDIKRTSSVIKMKGYEIFGLRLLQGLKKVKNPSVRKFKPGDADRLFELMKDHADNNQLAMVREHDDFTWYLNHPAVNCVVHEDENGTIDGFVVAWKFLLAGFGKTVPFGWLDLVHTYRLSIPEASDLFKMLCITSKERGWAGIQSPYLPYFDPKPLKNAKFVFFGKKLIINLYKLVEIPLPDEVQSFYFDWR